MKTVIDYNGCNSFAGEVGLEVKGKVTADELYVGNYKVDSVNLVKFSNALVNLDAVKESCDSTVLSVTNLNIKLNELFELHKQEIAGLKKEIEELKTKLKTETTVTAEKSDKKVAKKPLKEDIEP